MADTAADIAIDTDTDTDAADAVRKIVRALEAETLGPEDALEPLVRAAHDAKTLGGRVAAYRALGALSGRAYGAKWEIAERAAFALLYVARDADTPAERALLLQAMGRGFRNAWLMPYVHGRLFDEDETVVVAAISAAGGLAFPALEETIASTFLGDDVAPPVRAAAIAALGRMGAESAAERLVPFITRSADDSTAALAALTEMRSRAGRDAALAVLADEPSREVLLGAVRYLAEIGEAEVRRTLRALARDEDTELRLAASFAWRALDAELASDAEERILAALTERDRAVRARLARRLRTLPVSDVLEHASVLLADDPRGVIQVVAEVRAPEVTRFLLGIARDESQPVDVRTRAAGSIEPNDAWERDALVELVASKTDAAVRVAATRTLGAFAPTSFVLDRLSSLADDPDPSVRGALLWAIQLSARPRDLGGKERTRSEAILRAALTDEDPSVRRRAAYVAGNLDAAALVPDLVALARAESERADLRVAAFVALGEIASPARFADLVHLWNREDDPHVLGAASRALEQSLLASSSSAGPSSTPAGPPSSPPSAPPSLARVHDRLPKLLASKDARVRAAAARVAGLAVGAVPLEPIAALLEDPSPRVREKAVTALARIDGARAESMLVAALDDADAAVQERAAEALLAVGTASAAARVLEFVSRTPDRAAALRVARRLTVRRDDDEQSARIGEALDRVGPDDPIYETLVALKLAVLEATRPAASRVGSIDDAIAEAFPSFVRLRSERSFASLARSLRTAEMLHASTDRGSDDDHSAAIILWTKCLEGYLHGWLAPRLHSLLQRSTVLLELSDRVLGSGWPSYQRWLSQRWKDPVKVGALSVQVPLRSVVNALRDLSAGKTRPVDSPLSVTEWGRILLFLGLDHPSGPKNVLGVGCREPERTARLAHRLQVLAQVRNVVTHRSAADADTLVEFRRGYYVAFEDLAAMA